MAKRSQLSAYPSAKSFLTEIPIAYARRHVMLGLSETDTGLTLALGKRDAWPQLDVLRRLLARHVTPLFAPPKKFSG